MSILELLSGTRLLQGMMFALVVSGLQAHRAQGDELGREEYRLNCLVCHGAAGKGDGPLAAYLDPKPSDLTQIAKNHGGKFPMHWVMDVIDGREVVAVHGPRQMPVWGQRFRDEEPATGKRRQDSRLTARGRILSLGYYLRTVQEE